MTNLNTYKGIAVALGIGLAILWIAGLSSPYTPGWLTWLVGVAAVCEFFIAGRATGRDFRFQRNAPILVSVGLFVLWIIGLATGASMWMSWWTFGFACASMIFGVSATSASSFPPEERRPVEEQKRYDQNSDKAA